MVDRPDQDSISGSREISLLQYFQSTLGIAAGAALAAAIELGQRAEFKGKVIVAILPSFAERYLSTPLFEGLGEDTPS